MNFPNAQNINCDSIARFLDKNKWDVHTMYVESLPIDKKAYDTAHIHLHKIKGKIIWPLYRIAAMIFGNYDVMYLPKAARTDKFAGHLFKHSKTALVSSVEGVVRETIEENKKRYDYFNLIMDDYFVISECIQSSVLQNWGGIREGLFTLD